MFFYDWTFFMIIPVLIFTFWAQSKVKGKYNKYKRIPNEKNLSGKEIAREILRRNDLHDVEIEVTEGTLSDHYDPRSKTLKLSEEIYHGISISAAGIAAHEVGHAMQHAHNYLPLKFRSNIFPVANIGSKLALPLFLFGFLFSTGFLMDLGIYLFAGALIFHLVTLPVEFNASKQAMRQLANNLITTEQEKKGVKAVLDAAALTYVASTLMALVHFLRLIILRNARN